MQAQLEIPPSTKLLVNSRRVAVTYPELSMGSVSRELGILAATAARWSDAERHFEAALEANERIGARPWLARTEEGYARMRAARGDAVTERGAVRLPPARSSATAVWEWRASWPRSRSSSGRSERRGRVSAGVSVYRSVERTYTARVQAGPH